MVETRRNRGSSSLASAAAVFSAALLAPASAQVTQRVSLDSGGAQGNRDSFDCSISADGRYVAFRSIAGNLVPGDTNRVSDVLVRDRQSGATERASVDSSGAQVYGETRAPSISADGRFVAFESTARNLVPGDTNGRMDIFVRDRQSGTTEWISIHSSGAQGHGDCEDSSISADGRYVAFESFATDLVPGDTNGDWDVFVRDRQNGTTERISLHSSGAQGNGESVDSSISADGRYVAFTSLASNLVAGDTNATFDVFVRDLLSGTTARVSLGSGGAQGTNASRGPSISADGRYVAFMSWASDLVAGDTNGQPDIIVRDLQSGTTERVSVDSSGVQGSYSSSYPSISADGRYVAFESQASNLVPGDTNGQPDVFVRDLQSGTTERVSVDSSGVQGNGHTHGPSISADGRYVVFESEASNLVPADTNERLDVFVRVLLGGTSFTSLCDPGAGGVIACPCANPPSGPGRGCDNSSSTGGASLAAWGGTFLSSDTLVFTASGVRPTSTSVLVQGTSASSSGVVYGQGVRCVGGILKRLFTKDASGGSITAPNFAAGDPTVSARSAAMGNPISAGQSRWYLVFYRDPIVLGGCPSGSTFNATQTGLVTWSP